MAKPQGFSLLELLIVIAIGVVSISMGLPAFQQHVTTKKLQNDVAALGRLVDNARSIAARSQCDISVILQQQTTGDDKGLWVKTEVARNRSEACTVWLQSTNNASTGDSAKMSDQLIRGASASPANLSFRIANRGLNIQQSSGAPLGKSGLPFRLQRNDASLELGVYDEGIKNANSAR